MIKKIGVLTSGGDSPGMNAAVRAVVRAGLSKNIEMVSIQDGYLGLHQNQITKFERHDVSEIINRGGTTLGTSRFEGFKQQKVREECIENIKQHNLDALVLIGGDGTFRGARALAQMGVKCIAVPGTIDNDIAGTDYTIGFQTALNTVIEAVDRLRDTGTSHKRVSIVEIMGRHCGDLTMQAAIASGAEYAIVPEKEFDESHLIEVIEQGAKNGKKHGIIALTENITDADALAERVEAKTGLATKATILGLIQRGGSPCSFDRMLASQMGAFAVEILLKGIHSRSIGIQNNEMVHHDIVDVIENMKKPFREDLYELTQDLA